MNGFCIAALSTEASLRPAHGILRSQALLVTRDARVAATSMVAQARSEADAIVEAARQEAERIRVEAMEQARHKAADVEKETLVRGRQWLHALEQTQSLLLDSAQETVLDLAQSLFDRLVLEATPRERIEAGLRRLVQETPRRIVTPVLHVHPEDAALLPRTDWDVESDASMERGTCRLEAASGEWTFGFDAAAQVLAGAFGETGQVNQAAASPHCEGK